ncbi:hypothetical protein QYE76_048712 [Lolium multiflorum]|uniref:CCHC-type domain-containing protein n=1 Tax=Lolium multiflorum TaxID=4521 RepID=A0AAD8SLJ1_LOLMU|nr:hypothetical protein QYE76_048712 [Lolium multiflorum]
MIHTSVGTKDLALVRNFATAKEAWEGLAISFMGSESMKRNKYSALRNQAEGFMRLPDEDHQVMYRRLISVADAFRNVGAQHIDDFWIKDKYIDCMMPFEPVDVKSLLGRESYPSLTSQQVVHELQALKVAEQNSQDSRNHALGMASGTNLALTVNSVEVVNTQEPYRTSWSMSYPDDLEYHYNDHMAFHAKTFWVDPSKAKEDNIKRNNSSGFKSLGPRSRSCYNCGDKNHFIAECPYEHRETRGGRLIPKNKSKDSKAPNKKFYNKSKKNKKPSRIVLMTKEEYSSDDIESSSDEEETSKEVAAFVTTNIPSSSLFESPNENPHIKNAHCFMARSSLDTSIVLSTQEEYTGMMMMKKKMKPPMGWLLLLPSPPTLHHQLNPPMRIFTWRKKVSSWLNLPRLKDELAKASSPQSKLSLDDLFSKQRSNNGKEGLCFIAKAKKANKKKAKPAQEKKKVITNGDAPKAKTINDDNAGITNPHYIIIESCSVKFEENDGSQVGQVDVCAGDEIPQDAIVRMWDFSAPLRDTVWRLGKDYALLWWSPHLHNINQLHLLKLMMHQPKNKNKTLPLMCKIKDKINQGLMIAPMSIHSIFSPHRIMSKIKHMMVSTLMKLRKLNLKVKTGTQTIKLIK